MMMMITGAIWMAAGAGALGVAVSPAAAFALAMALFGAALWAAGAADEIRRR